METGMYMLPVRCKGCNSIFDLWRVLQEQETKGGFAQTERLNSLSQSFCPRCRTAVLSELGEMGEDSEEFDDADSNIQEYEMSIDFE